MKKLQGITEPFWTEFPEDRRLIWKYANRALGLLAALLLAKTGNMYVDWLLTVVTAIFLMVAIETQRTYSRLSPRLRKFNTRFLIFLGSWGIAFVGIAYLSQVAVVASVSVLTNELRPAIERDHDVLRSLVIITMFIVIVPITVIRVIRQLDIEQLILHLPRQGLKKLFMRRPYKATSFFLFAYFELTLLMVCLMYATAVVSLVQSLMVLIGIS